MLLVPALLFWAMEVTVVNHFSVRFWGVRGSIATAGREYAKVGGHTSCVEVRAGDEIIILDAGTGLFPLGQTLGSSLHATFFLSHFHWDHIQGFPHFRPAYVRGNAFTICGREGLEEALARQMQPPNFPVTLSAMGARLQFRSLKLGEEVSVGAARVCAVALNHPQGCLGYRITFAGLAVVYASDTEHVGPAVADPRTIELARRADLLIYDAQYTDDEYYGRNGPARRGWGHSTIREACRIACVSGVGRLALFHHDPTRDDRMVERLTAQARHLFPQVFAAREGLVVNLFEPEQIAQNTGARILSASESSDSRV